MGVRDRLAQIRKVFGTSVPADIQAGEQAAGMGPTQPFSPGEPIGPYDGYSRTPRARDFVTGYNIATRPRTHERVAFDTLKGLIDAYDVAQACIWHRIDSIRALDWSLVPARGFSGDADAAIAVGMAALKKPDRKTPFANWLAKWLYDTLAYDAGTLYKLRNRRGDVIGLSVVDGTTVAPLLDYWGNSPEHPAPAYVQYANGLPWNWLTRDDLIYEPFRPIPGSAYGKAPLETILLNANTDLRFQAYFLQRFTEGNIPAAFASAPETWTPQNIEQFQEYWDAFMLGDQAAKHQIKWIPGGSSIAWSNEKDFTDAFSLFLMRKTCAAFHIVPSDLGFTESVNKSSGETQADVQHRVGDLPLVAHISGVLTHFLQQDLGLPLEFAFDTGQEKEDRLALAQAWQIYIESGMASPDEGREQLLGLPGDPRRPTPRFFSTTRLGPVPLLAIDGVAGKVDPETFGPAQDQPVLYQPFVPPPGVVPAAGTTDAKASVAAEDAYQVHVRDQMQAEGAGQPVTKDGEVGGLTAGITSETGITSYDLAGHRRAVDEEEEELGQEELVKSELAAFRSFRKARRRARMWRDFEFRHVDPRTGRRLNQHGRAAVRKDAGEVAVAGLAVQAADTGRVLMIQRALDPDDPAGGKWEFPGGHLEEDEAAVAAAAREWCEETGFILPYNPEGMAALAFGGPSWVNGIYAGFIYPVASESVLDLARRNQVANPDDPDADQVEAIAWWDPEQLRGNPVVREELLDSLDLVLEALGLPVADDPAEPLEKAGGGGPKGEAPDGAWPGWEHDQRTARHWAPLIAAALAGALATAQARRIARDYASSGLTDDGQDRRAHVAAVAAWLATQGINPSGPVADQLTGLYTDGYFIGAASAHAVVDGARVQLADWQPGHTDTARSRIAEIGLTLGLATLIEAVEEAARGITESRLKGVARALIDGTAAGDSADDIGVVLESALADLDSATAAATTEITRASGLGALDAYQQRNIAMGYWATEGDRKVCALCDANAAAGPVRMGGRYPSGDAYPPAHYRCRCAVLPA